jgi:methionyl-tRNA synthetase
MQDFALHTMLAEIWGVVSEANRYFAAAEPWVLRKTDPARMGTVLYVTAEVLRMVAIMAQPVVPAAAAKLLDLLAVPDSKRTFSGIGGGQRLTVATRLMQPEPIFPRYIEPEP